MTSHRNIMSSEPAEPTDVPTSGGTSNHEDQQTAPQDSWKIEVAFPHQSSGYWLYRTQIHPRASPPLYNPSNSAMVQAAVRNLQQAVDASEPTVPSSLQGEYLVEVRHREPQLRFCHAALTLPGEDPIQAGAGVFADWGTSDSRTRLRSDSTILGVQLASSDREVVTGTGELKRGSYWWHEIDSRDMGLREVRQAWNTARWVPPTLHHADQEPTLSLMERKPNRDDE